MCTLDFLTNMAEHIVEEKKILRFVNTKILDKKRKKWRELLPDQ
jgi:hypothetical protein